MTPLHYAAFSGHDEAIKVLVQEGRAQLRVLDKVVCLLYVCIGILSFCLYLIRCRGHHLTKGRQAAAGLC